MDLPARHFLGRRNTGFQYICVLGKFRGTINELGEYSPEGLATGSEVRLKHLPSHVLPGNRGDYLDVFVSHVENPVKVFVQLMNETKYVRDLERKLQESYTQTEPLPLINPARCDLCAVYDQKKGFWCRGAVMSRPDQMRVKVFYVDYGNVAVFDKMDVMELRREFRKYPPYAIRIMVIGVRDNTRPDLIQSLLESKIGVIQLESCTGIGYSATMMVQPSCGGDYEKVNMHMVEELSSRRQEMAGAKAPLRAQRF